MNLTLDIENIDNGYKALSQLAVDTGTSLKFICMDQMRLWCRDLMIRVAGEAGTGGAATNSLLSKHKKGMEQSVQSDLNKVFNVIEPRKSKRIGTEYLIWINGKDSGETPFKVTPIINLKAHHQRQRTTRKKKVPRSGYDYGWVTKQNFIKYRKWVRSHIGTVKAGFAAPYSEFSKKTRATARIPKWISRNMGRSGGGKAVTATMDKSGNGILIGKNNVSYASDAMGKSVWQFTKKNRAEDINFQVDRRFKEIIKRFNNG